MRQLVCLHPNWGTRIGDAIYHWVDLLAAFLTRTMLQINAFHAKKKKINNNNNNNNKKKRILYTRKREPRLALY